MDKTTEITTKSELTAKMIASDADRVRIVVWTGNMILDIAEFVAKPSKHYIPLRIAKGKKLAAYATKYVDHAFSCNATRITLEELYTDPMGRW